MEYEKFNILWNFKCFFLCCYEFFFIREKCLFKLNIIYRYGNSVGRVAVEVADRGGLEERWVEGGERGWVLGFMWGVVRATPITMVPTTGVGGSRVVAGVRFGLGGQVGFFVGGF